MDTGLSAGTGANTQRQSQVNDQLSTLEKSISVLHSLVDQVFERIDAILSDPTPPSEQKAPAQVESKIVSHAEILRDYWRGIQRANRRLEELLNRIEL